jgi:methylphosphotriester-DNA--protein-cysteine methyltransferase
VWPQHPPSEKGATSNQQPNQARRAVQEFGEQVGLSPRTLARILRMRRLLQVIDVYGSVGWADKAELGWFDQAHLIRDFKRHTGVTPSQYLSAQRSTYDRTEAASSAGFVPEAM